MAIAVIGGLVTSTFLSLLVIPVVFTYVDDVVQKLKRLLGHLHLHRHTPGSAPSGALPGAAERH